MMFSYMFLYIRHKSCERGPGEEIKRRVILHAILQVTLNAPARCHSTRPAGARAPRRILRLKPLPPAPIENREGQEQAEYDS